mmetsp:Transcript_95800/g.308956  ORF Transcript_95800/g.308956 Transcript_95800/m.308956 type:complete len:275 (+) Transcript_95800:185-1009(+)
MSHQVDCTRGPPRRAHGRHRRPLRPDGVEDLRSAEHTLAVVAAEDVAPPSNSCSSCIVAGRSHRGYQSLPRSRTLLEALHRAPTMFPLALAAAHPEPRAPGGHRGSFSRHRHRGSRAPEADERAEALDGAQRVIELVCAATDVDHAAQRSSAEPRPALEHKRLRRPMADHRVVAFHRVERDALVSLRGLPSAGVDAIVIDHGGQAVSRYQHRCDGPPRAHRRVEALHGAQRLAAGAPAADEDDAPQHPGPMQPSSFCERWQSFPAASHGHELLR